MQLACENPGVEISGVFLKQPAHRVSKGACPRLVLGGPGGDQVGLCIILTEDFLGLLKQVISFSRNKSTLSVCFL